MEIDRKKLNEIAKDFLRIIDSAGLKETRQLEKLVGYKVEVEKRKRDFVEISLRSSNFGTSAYTLSYVIPHRQDVIEGGIPLEVKVNVDKGYSKIIIKTQLEVEGYSPFSRDVFENIIQERNLQFTDWKKVKEEVEKLIEDPNKK